jgi:hypothetical protein
MAYFTRASECFDEKSRYKREQPEFASGLVYYAGDFNVTEIPPNKL